MELEKSGFNKKYQYSFLIGGGTILVLVIVFFAAINPLFKNSKKLRAELNTKKDHLAYLQDKKSKLDNLKDREEELRADAERVSAALPSEKDAGRLFIQFDEIAEAAKGKVKSVSEAKASTTNVGGSLAKISYTEPIELPSYLNFKELLKNSEEALRIFTIDSIELSGDESGSSLSSSLTITTFMRAK